MPSVTQGANGTTAVFGSAKTLDAIAAGLSRVLTHLGITNETFSPPPQSTLITHRKWISAPSDGSWNSTVQAGHRVRKGERLGYLTDWHGQTIFEARAPFSKLH